MEPDKIRQIALDQSGEAIQGIPLGSGAIFEPVTIPDQGFYDWDVSPYAVIQWNSSEELRFGVNEEMSEAGVGPHYDSYAERYPLTKSVTQVRFFNNSGAAAKLCRLVRLSK